MITLDTLRYDVATAELGARRTPNLARLLGPAGWEARHTPATFTLPAHLSFFHGFFPTPLSGPGERPLAVAFAGSETITDRTAVLDAPDLVRGLAAIGYHTVCIGGTGFFNPASPLGRVLPGLFVEAHWAPELGVTDPRSTEHQAALAVEVLSRSPPPLFLFLNVSAIHQPNRFYLPGAIEDSVETHAAALRYVDGALGPLVDALLARSPLMLFIGADHGTCYGEDGHVGHRVAHPAVWTVPWAERAW